MLICITWLHAVQWINLFYCTAHIFLIKPSITKIRYCYTLLNVSLFEIAKYPLFMTPKKVLQASKIIILCTCYDLKMVFSYLSLRKKKMYNILKLTTKYIMFFHSDQPYNDRYEWFAVRLEDVLLC